MVAPQHRSPDDEAAKRSEHEEVHKRLALGAHARGVDQLPELRARARAFLSQRALDHRDAPLGGVGAHALLPEAPRAGGEQRRCGERMEPRIVLAARQVERPAVQPGDHERAILG